MDTCDLSSPDPGVLWADGATLRDANQRVVTLRGINAGGRSKMPPYSPFDYTDYDSALADYLDTAASWGIDVLRVPFSWAAMEPEPGVDDEEWLERYDALLDGAWERGLWTIVDFHQDIYAENYCGDGFPTWTLADPDPPDPHWDCETWFFEYDSDEVQAAFDDFWADTYGARTAFEAMWERMAARHAGRPGVIGFEIINEPHEGSASASTWQEETLAPFYTEMAAIIHAVAPDQLVLFDATGLDGVNAETDMPRPEGDGLMFAPHFYDPLAFLGATADADNVRAGLTAWADKAYEWDMPVIIGEFGAPGDDLQAAQTSLEAHYEVIEEVGLHSTQWEYSASVDSWNFEDFSVVHADGTERPELLSPLIRPYIRLLAGEDLTFFYDHYTHTLIATWNAEEDGVTEVMLPKRLYGDDATVLADGACIDRRDDRVLVSGSGTVRLEVRSH